MKRSAYEQALDDKTYSHINEYDNTDKLFKKEVYQILIDRKEQDDNITISKR